MHGTCAQSKPTLHQTTKGNLGDKVTKHNWLARPLCQIAERNTCVMYIELHGSPNQYHNVPQLVLAIPCTSAEHVMFQTAQYTT